MAAGTLATHFPSPENFAARSARRALVIGGILLIIMGMLFGDLFAIFVLHQNASRINEQFVAALQAVSAGDSNRAAAAIQELGGLAENRGTKVDSHAHLVAFGYIALVLALLQPFVSISERARKRLAMLFLLGASLLPTGVFLIHYVGLSGSPFKDLGWASVAADFGGLLVFVVVAFELVGLFRYWRQRVPLRAAKRDELLQDKSWCGRVLLSGGTLLILAGFVHGAYYSGAHLYAYEAEESALLRQMSTGAALAKSSDVTAALTAYGQLQGAKAVNIAAHAHVIEFGILCMLMAFFQPYVFLTEKWRRVWTVVLLAGSLMLPVFVLLESRFGLVPGGIADAGGLLVIIALTGMLTGVLRYTGGVDSAHDRSYEVRT